jgi:multidrug resistance efflux pump
MALCLTMCSPAPQTSPTPTAALAPSGNQAPSQEAFGSISANGVLLPAKQIELSFGVSGIVESVEVEIGETVSAGQTLARLDDTEARLAVQSAQAELAAAQAGYDLAASGMTAEQATASLELIQAQQALEALYDEASSARANAFQEIGDASKALEQASYLLYYYNVPLSLAGLDSLDALAFAREGLERARADFEPFINAPSGDETRKSLKEKLDRAQGDYNSAARRVELEASVLAAQARLEAAQRDYESRRDGPDPTEAALAEAQLEQAQAQWALAGGESDAPGKLALAEAQVGAARLKLEMAQAQLEQLTISAPIDGVVSALRIDPGEWAVPGETAIEVLDLSHWRVETKNVSELQIGRVQIGQEVRVWANAFRDETLTGRVIAISPEAVVQQGDITYTLIIALDPTKLNLRPGMTARVEILSH